MKSWGREPNHHLKPKRLQGSCLLNKINTTRFKDKLSILTGKGKLAPLRYSTDKQKKLKIEM